MQYRTINTCAYILAYTDTKFIFLHINTLKNRFLFSSKTSSPDGSDDILLRISFLLIGPVCAQDKDELEGSLKKSLANFSVSGRSKSARYNVMPFIFGSSKALIRRVSLKKKPDVAIFPTSLLSAKAGIEDMKVDATAIAANGFLTVSMKKFPSLVA